MRAYTVRAGIAIGLGLGLHHSTKFWVFGKKITVIWTKVRNCMEESSKHNLG